MTGVFAPHKTMTMPTSGSFETLCGRKTIHTHTGKFVDPVRRGSLTARITGSRIPNQIIHARRKPAWVVGESPDFGKNNFKSQLAKERCEKPQY